MQLRPIRGLFLLLCLIYNICKYYNVYSNQSPFDPCIFEKPSAFINQKIVEVKSPLSRRLFYS